VPRKRSGKKGEILREERNVDVRSEGLEKAAELRGSKPCCFALWAAHLSGAPAIRNRRRIPTPG